jgi:hypothetical protein
MPCYNLCTGLAAKTIWHVLFYLRPWVEDSVSRAEARWNKWHTLYFLHPALHFNDFGLHFLHIVQHLLQSYVGFVGT